jgi:hypothetical protein
MTNLLVSTKTSSDMAHGQAVIVTARWILVASGLGLALTHARSLEQLRVQIVLILLIAMANFGLQAQLLRRRTAAEWVAYAASAADLVVVTALVIAQGGFTSALYVFYFPAILALSVAFDWWVTAIYAYLAVLLYGSVAMMTAQNLPASGPDIVARCLVLAAVAACGAVYRLIEQGRREADARDHDPAPTPRQEEVEDVFFGQVVMIWGRWGVIVTAAVVIVWTATSTSDLAGRVLLVVALMALNFFLHGRYLVERPLNRAVVMVAGLVDVVLITSVILLWSGGFESQLFVLYYPVVFAFALVFRPRLAAAFTATTLALYAAACVLAGTSFLADVDLDKNLLERLITLAAMGGLGTYYWRIQRERRRADQSWEAQPA